MRTVERVFKALLLSSMALAVPLAWGWRGRPGIALVCFCALTLAAGVPRLGPRVGLHLGGRLELVWLMPFAACWGFGEGLAFFERVWWWDKLTHAIGGGAVFVLFLAYAAVRSRLSARARAVIGVLLALGVGAGWELLEFTSDQLLGTRTQAGNFDTMTDLAFDLVGGLAVAATLAVVERVRASRSSLAEPAAGRVR